MMERLIWSDIIFHPFVCKGGDESCVGEVVAEVGEKVVVGGVVCDCDMGDSEKCQWGH